MKISCFNCLLLSTILASCTSHSRSDSQMNDTVAVTEYEMNISQEVVDEHPTLTFNRSSDMTSEQEIVLNEIINAMVYVEGGTFTMGVVPELDNESFDDVTLSDFYISKYEVTQKQWETIMGDNPSQFSFLTDNDNYPVEHVTWNDCMAFVEQLRSLTGLEFRLPTEAQWEYAARGGQKSKSYMYSGSNDPDEVAWQWQNSEQDFYCNEFPHLNGKQRYPHKVGKKKPNELGLYDMSGNVAEWCFDQYGDYYSNYLHYCSLRNPTGAKSGDFRVFRGGSYASGVMPINNECCVDYRQKTLPHLKEEPIGMRLAIYIDDNSSDNNSTKTLCEGEVIDEHDGEDIDTCNTEDIDALEWDGPYSPTWSSNVSPEQKRILTELIKSMVKIDGGYFIMGADSKVYNEINRKLNGGVAHKVYISDFLIGKYEITQEQWECVMGYNPSFFKGSHRPVENISWNDCCKFILKLNAITGLSFSFPTEAQWEYAGRGGMIGMISKDNNDRLFSKDYKYSDIDSVAWHYENTSETNIVGLKQANELGLHDMIGNVAEWCYDIFDLYRSEDQWDPNGPDEDKLNSHVVRGGSWNEDYASSYRYSVRTRRSEPPSYHGKDIGLRLALNIINIW